MLIQDLNIRVIAATAGAILRELTLDLDKDYQPQKHGNSKILGVHEFPMS